MYISVGQYRFNVDSPGLPLDESCLTPMLHDCTRQCRDCCISHLASHHPYYSATTRRASHLQLLKWCVFVLSKRRRRLRPLPPRRTSNVEQNESQLVDASLGHRKQSSASGNVLRESKRFLPNLTENKQSLQPPPSPS